MYIYYSEKAPGARVQFRETERYYNNNNNNNDNVAKKTWIILGIGE